MRIVFVRHGEPNYEKDCLTATGKIQAELVAERLRDENISEIWASPLGRASETAEYTGKLLGMPVHTLDFMREVDWGSTDGNPLFADGHPWFIADEMARRGMELNTPDWRESPFFCTNSVVECIDRIDRGIDEWLENFGYKRNGKYYQHLSEEKEHRTIALFSHGGSSCAAMGHILNLPFPYACALLHIDYTGITVVRFDRGEGNTTLPCLELANDSRHLCESGDNRVWGKTDNETVGIDPGDILYLESVDDKVFAYTKDRVIRLEGSLSSFGHVNKDDYFFRCSKSMIININRLSALKSLSSNRIDATLENGEHVIISRRYASEFRRVLRGDR